MPFLHQQATITTLNTRWRVVTTSGPAPLGLLQQTESEEYFVPRTFYSFY